VRGARGVYGKVVGVAVIGVQGFPVAVEAHIGRGLPSLAMTGLPGASVQDARERVRPAVESSGFEWPLRRVVVNLSPVNLRKDGPGLDLPIAMGVLAASAQIPGTLLGRYAFSGELSLRGELMPTPGILAVAIAAAGAAVAWGQGAARLSRGLLLAAAAANALVVIAWFAELNPLAVVLGGESRDRFLARRLDYYPYYEIVNRATPPDSRVWLVNTTRDTYHLERPYFADYLFGAYTISQWVREAKDADELRARARARGLMHVLVRHDTLLDAARSPIVDDAEPVEVNRRHLERLYGFLTQGTRLVQGGAKFWLIELR